MKLSNRPLFLFCWLLQSACWIAFSVSCSPPATCQEGTYTNNSINPSGSPCQQDCECRNQQFEGHCITNEDTKRKLCVAVKRSGCASAGVREFCTVQDFFKSVVSCHRGEKICQEKGLEQLVWGDCRCVDKIDCTNPNAHKDCPSDLKDNCSLWCQCRLANDHTGAQQCFTLGRLYETGPAPAQNLEKARAHYESACALDHAPACARFGQLLLEPSGKEQWSKAKQLLEKACRLLDAKGCTTLARMFRRGEGVDKDTKRAATLFEKACKLDDREGCLQLGLMVRDGEGVDKDTKRAATLFEKACKLDEKMACGALGEMSATGQGLPKDCDKAKTLYKKACSLGQIDYCDKPCS